MLAVKNGMQSTSPIADCRDGTRFERNDDGEGLHPDIKSLTIATSRNLPVKDGPSLV